MNYQDSLKGDSAQPVNYSFVVASSGFVCLFFNLKDRALHKCTSWVLNSNGKPSI